MIFDLDESRLDDVEALSIADPGDMLRAVATGGAQIRRALTLTAESDLDRLVADGLPRSVVLTGTRTSSLVARLLPVLAGTAARIPVLPLTAADVGQPRHDVPAWVGAMDVVVAISASGSTPATLATVEEAGRRGARVLTVGPRNTPLENVSLQVRGVHIDPDLDDRPARASFWSLAVPALRLMDAWDLVPASADSLDTIADLADDVAERCGPTVDLLTNPAKAVAVEIAGSLPVFVGATPLSAFAAQYFAANLASDAGYPSSVAVSHVSALFTGAFGDAAAESGQPDDFFRDRIEDDEVGMRVRLVLLSDISPDTSDDRLRRAAEDRGVGVSELRAVGTQPLERVATLTALSDFVSVYLALALGVDPTRTPLDTLEMP